MQIPVTIVQAAEPDVLTGSGPPGVSVGSAGNVYIDSDTGDVYGPKLASPALLVGEDAFTGSGHVISFNYKQVSPYAAATGGAVSSLIAYLAGGGGGDQALRLIANRDTGNGLPGAVVATSDQTTVLSAQAAGWVEAALPSPVLFVADNYWLGLFAGGPGTANYYDPVVEVDRAYKAEAYAASPSDPFGIPDAFAGDAIAIYAETVWPYFGTIPSSSYDGWTSANETWTYVSASTFTVPGDQRGKFTVGARIKLSQSGSLKYFVVAADPSFGSGVTTVTITGGGDFALANSAITLNYYSYEASPQGYPGFFNWTPTEVGWSSTTVFACRFSVVGRQCFVDLSVAGTSDSATTTLTAPIEAASTQWPFSIGIVKNNSGSYQPGRCYLSSTTVFTFGPNVASPDTWTASGDKELTFGFWYEI